MNAFVQILLTLSVACVCVCMAEENGQIHWAVAMGKTHQVGRVERKSNDAVDSVESILTEEGERGRRSLTPSDRTSSLTMMNNLRRTIGASNMPYLTYDVGGENDAASWTYSCNFDATVNEPTYANGFKYLTTNSMTIANVIKELYKLFPKEMSSVFLTSFGCDLHQCSSAYYKGITYQNAQLTLCLFNGDSGYDSTKYQYKLSEGCTECSSGSYWCDYGLCRADCPPGDSCYCNAYCLNCATTNATTCTCQCLNGWTGSRCENKSGVNASTPTCSTTPRVPKTITTMNPNNAAFTGVSVIQLVFCATVALLVKF